MVWINPASNCKMVVKRITTFFLKRYLFRVFYFFWRGGAGKSEPDSISTPLWLPQNLYNILFLGRIRKRRRCNLLLTSTLDLKNQAVNEGMQPWRRYRWSVISINLLLTCLGDEQRSQNMTTFPYEMMSKYRQMIGKMDGTLQMVPLIINPMYTLYGGHLLGPNPILKTWENMSFLFSAPIHVVCPPQARNDFQFEDIFVSYHAGSPKNQRLLANSWRIFHVFTRFQANAQWLVARFLNLQ